MTYEYQVIPAPTRGLKVKGLKAPEARFAYAMQEVLNEMAAEGWEFLRAETLPSTERSGLTSSTTVFRNLLVFRRPATGEEVEPAEELYEEPEEPAVEPEPEPAAEEPRQTN